MEHNVVIIGGGFGGLHAALSLKHAPVKVTIIDKRNFHLFQPLLYQVATGGLSYANIASTLRTILAKQRNAHVILGEVIGLDPGRKMVLLEGREIKYDTLIVATGSDVHYFGHDSWEEFAPGLKTIEDAHRILNCIMKAFEEAEKETDPEMIKRWLTFVIIGGGPTGVEVAGALAEIKNLTLRDEFRSIRPSDANIVLIEGANRVLPLYPPRLSDMAASALEKLGITIRLSTYVTCIEKDSITFRKDESAETIFTNTVIWAAGIKGSSSGRYMVEKFGSECDRIGRIVVENDCSLKDHSEVFIIGDLAHFVGEDGKPLPGLAPVAVQQGEYVGKLISNRLKGRKTPTFKYRDYGVMSTIGRNAAVAKVGKMEFSGAVAWFLWLFVHLMSIVGFENRFLILIQWAWNYFTWHKSARVIIGNGCDNDAGG